MSKAELISVSAAAREACCTLKTIYDWIKTGKLQVSEGVGRNKAPAKFVSRAAVEALAGHKIEPEPTPKRDPVLDYKFTIADIAFIWRAMAEKRDTAWRDACECAGVQVSTPPMPSECRLDPSYYGRFTQSQVYEFLQSATAQRDLEWRAWAEDPLYRAKFPAGPAQFTIADLATSTNLEQTK